MVAKETKVNNLTLLTEGLVSVGETALSFDGAMKVSEINEWKVCKYVTYATLNSCVNLACLVSKHAIIT